MILHGILRLKRFPDGLINKPKARIYDCGDQRLKGDYLFETYAPVVKWPTGIIMLVLEVLFEFK